MQPETGSTLVVASMRGFGRVKITFSGLSAMRGKSVLRQLHPGYLVEVPRELACSENDVATAIGLAPGCAREQIEHRLREIAQTLPLSGCCLVEACGPDLLPAPNFIDIPAALAILSQSPGKMWHRNKRPNLEVLARRHRLALVIMEGAASP